MIWISRFLGLKYCFIGLNRVEYSPEHRVDVHEHGKVGEMLALTPGHHYHHHYNHHHNHSYQYHHHCSHLVLCSLVSRVKHPELFQALEN